MKALQRSVVMLHPFHGQWSLGIVALILFWTATPASGRICDIKIVLDQCPTSSSVISQIRNDFVIRRDGVVVTDISCPSTSISNIPVAQYTDELIVLQTLRTIYFIDKGRKGHLPWDRSTNLYGWLLKGVSGVNITSTGPDQFVGNAFGDGRSYFNVRAKDDFNRDWMRSWKGMAEFIGLMMHERRHADGFPHSSCCPDGPGACDQEYNEANLSPYGIQWWLRKQWIEGGLYTGYACYSAAEVNDIKDFLRNAANQERSRYCQNPPPFLTDVNNPVSSCRRWICLRYPGPGSVWQVVVIGLTTILLIAVVAWRFVKSRQAAEISGPGR